MKSKENKRRFVTQRILCICVITVTGIVSFHEIGGNDKAVLPINKYSDNQNNRTMEISLTTENYSSVEYCAYIKSNAVPIKNEADDEATVMFIADYADKVKIIGEDRGESYGWTKINIDGHIGYVKSNYLSLEELACQFDYGIDEVELYYNDHYNDDIKKERTIIGEDTYNRNFADIVVARAYELIGVPYGHGNTSRLTDCVGLTQMCYGTVGISLPWSLDQKDYGTSVPYEDIRKGDLLVWSPLNENRVSHVGIYIGNGEMIHASCSKGVAETSVAHYIKYGGNLVDIRRIV